ncbi:hypothetical protein NP569_27595, partial [Vibrio parahaemolyticus]|nr:hypothetical protein [Vibrio parahaemolyticus]
YRFLAGRFEIRIGEKAFVGRLVDASRALEGSLRFELDGVIYRADLARDEEGLWVQVDANARTVFLRSLQRFPRVDAA